MVALFVEQLPLSKKVARWNPGQGRIFMFSLCISIIKNVFIYFLVRFVSDLESITLFY